MKELTFLHHEQIAFVRTLSTHAGMLLWLLLHNDNTISTIISTQVPSGLTLLCTEDLT